MKVILSILLICNVCYGQTDTSKVIEFKIATLDRNGNVIKEYTDSVHIKLDTTFYIKPKKAKVKFD